jgi:FHA domain
MTARCPHGHESQTADYCDQCGAPIGVATPGPTATAVLPVLEELDTSPSARREPCPACGAARSGDDRYCESCGFDFENPAPVAAPWEAVATADRAQFDRLAVDGVSFPDGYGERHFALREGENRIGRSRGQPGEEVPEIDLAAAPADPGVSRLHAVLEYRADGTCVLRDLESTNGTTLNDAPAAIAPHTDVPLSDGDRIRLGAWTTIIVRRR